MVRWSITDCLKSPESITDEWIDVAIKVGGGHKSLLRRYALVKGNSDEPEGGKEASGDPSLVHSDIAAKHIP